MEQVKHQYIELVVAKPAPSIVQSMVSIERSMQKAVNRLRTITKKGVMTTEEFQIKLNRTLEEARKYSDDIYIQMSYIEHSADIPNDIKLKATEFIIEQNKGV